MGSTAKYAMRRLLQLKSHLRQTRAHDLSTITSASLLRADPSEVLFENINNKGVITLNRVSAHNAVNHNMTVRIYNQLKVWEREQSVSLVIIKGAGSKAFCAGGDVRELSETARLDHSSPSAFQFLRDEYRTQYTIGTYPIPYIALVDGYCMGGGCGLAVNGRFRVATERAVMAMPETHIGFYPDNGGSYFLSRLIGELGTYLGLTCASVRGEDAYNTGLATHYVTSGNGKLERLEQDLISLTDPTESDVQSLLDHYHHKSYTGRSYSLKLHLSAINRIFSQCDLESIVDELEKENSTWAQETLTAISKASPTALKLSLRMLHEAKSMDLLDCLTVELRLGRTILCDANSDLFRGVQAVLVDKNARAQWYPSHVDDVTDQLVASHFTPLSEAGFSDFVSS